LVAFCFDVERDVLRFLCFFDPGDLPNPGIEARRRRGWRRMKWLDSITDSVDMNLSKLWETVKDRDAWRVAVHGVAELDMI